MSDIGEWLLWNRKGLFLAPEQPEPYFLAKIDYLLTASAQHGTPYGYPCVRLPTFDIDACWIPLYQGDEDISLLEGAVTWKEEKVWEDVVIQTPLIQLSNKIFNPLLRWIYPSHVLLNHEAIHAVRIDFPPSYFEEIFAYRSDSSLFRKIFGPLFASTKEVYQFLGLQAALLLAQLAIIVYASLDQWLAFPWFMIISLLPFFLRLTNKQYKIERCIHKLRPLMAKGTHPLALLIRLSDEEIEELYKRTSTRILAWVEGSIKDSLRWQILYQTYFDPANREKE